MGSRVPIRWRLNMRFSRAQKVTKILISKHVRALKLQALFTSGRICEKRSLFHSFSTGLSGLWLWKLSPVALFAAIYGKIFANRRSTHAVEKLCNACVPPSKKLHNFLLPIAPRLGRIPTRVSGRNGRSQREHSPVAAFLRRTTGRLRQLRWLAGRSG